MPLLSAAGALVFVGLGAIAADLLGNQSTRGFTRAVFIVTALHAFGVSISGLATWAGQVWGLLPI